MMAQIAGLYGSIPPTYKALLLAAASAYMGSHYGPWAQKALTCITG